MNPIFRVVVLPIQPSSTSSQLNPEPGDILVTRQETRLYRTNPMSMDMILDPDVYYHRLVSDDFITVPAGTIVTMLRYTEKTRLIQYLFAGTTKPTDTPEELMGHIMYVMHGPFGELWVTDLFADLSDLWNQFSRFMT